MMVSTKGRYALMVCLDLAQQDPEAYISLREVAQRQNISMKYLESIVAAAGSEPRRRCGVQMWAIGKKRAHVAPWAWQVQVIWDA